MTALWWTRATTLLLAWPSSVLASSLNQAFLHQPSSYQGCGSAFISSGSGSSILGWIPIRIQGFNGQKLRKKITAEKNYFFFCSNCNYVFLGLHKVRPSYRRSLQLSKEAIQHFKTWTLRNPASYYIVTVHRLFISLGKKLWKCRNWVLTWIVTVPGFRIRKGSRSRYLNGLHKR